MKLKAYFETHKRKAVIILLLAVAAVAAVIAVSLFVWRNQKNHAVFRADGSGIAGTMADGNFVSASGVTGVGMTQESLEVEGLTEGLLVEGVYVSSGQEVTAGDKLLKLSEESVETARKELEKTLQEADLAYRAGAIEYEQTKITAKYERDLAVLQGQQAQEVYEETAASLKDGVEQAQKQLDESQEKIAEYQEIVDGGDYYETYKVGEYKALYDENLELLKTRMEEWGADWSQVVSGAGQSGWSQNIQNAQSAQNMQNTQTAQPGTVSGSDLNSAGQQAGQTGQTGQAGPTSDQLSVLQSLYRVLEQNLRDYEEALEKYEDATDNVELNLQTLQLGLSSLEENLASAKQNRESQALQARLVLQQTLASAGRADSDYETAMEKALSDYETLQEKLEDARENLELFEASVGDGYYHAAESGTVLRVMAREGQYLNSEEPIFLYSNPQEMEVAVSVSQENVAAIQVGGTAYVESEEYGSFRGTVTRIDPISRSDSRTNVTYEVTVTLTGDVGNLPANEKVTVFLTGGSEDGTAEGTAAEAEGDE